MARMEPLKMNTNKKREKVRLKLIKMQSRITRAKHYGVTGKYYGRAPRGYSRARAQRAGQRAYRLARQYRRPRRRRNTRTGGFLGIEKKFYDTSLVGKALVTSVASGEVNPSTTVNFTSIAQGDGESNRDGRKAVIKSVYVTGTFNAVPQVNAVSADTQPTVCAYLVHDSQTNGAELNSEDVFLNPSADLNAATSVLRNLQFSSRFRILDSVQIALPAPTLTYDGTNMEQGGINIPFKLSWSGNMPIVYSGTTAVVSNTTDNSIQMIAYCTNTAIAPLITYNARTRFVG